MLIVVTPHGIGRIKGDMIEVLDLPYRNVTDLLRDAGSLAPARRARTVDEMPLESATLLCPLRPTAGIWGIGLNYHAKAKLTGRPIPETPILFLKPQSALAGPGDVLPIPTEESSELDYEAEVAVIIGRAVGGADPVSAWAAVAGITAANDMTARDIMRATASPMLAKSFDRFSPVGPSVLDADVIDADFDLAIRAFVNGELRQDGRTSDLIIGVGALIAYISRFATLQPGDIVLTGTPAGTGQDRGAFLKSGDEIVVDIEGLLPLVNVLGSIPAGIDIRS